MRRSSTPSPCPARHRSGCPSTWQATFRDAGVLDAHTVTVDWGDGSPLSTAAIDAGVGAATVPHTFSTPGTRTVRIDLRDDDGGATSETRTIVVAPTVTPTGLVVTVVGPLGPVRAAHVRVFAVGAVGPRAVASTSTDGTATFDTLPVGSYQIEVRPSGGQLRRAWYGGPDRTSATVVTGGEQQIAVTLEARP
ncbi:MAG: PKD domain-containing protein [Microthrixaceae bacterium]